MPKEKKKRYKWEKEFKECAFDDKEEFLWIYILGGCGCGSYEKNKKDVWKVFELFATPFNDRKFSIYDKREYEIIAHWLDSKNLIEHGTSIAESWLTEEGKKLYTLLKTKQPMPKQKKKIKKEKEIKVRKIEISKEFPNSMDAEGYPTIPSELEEKVEIVWGGWVNGENFEEYLKRMKRSLRKYLRALKDSGLWKNLYGSDMNDILWEFSDGKIILMSWRAFADFRAAAEGKGENYLTYYSRF